MFFVARRAQERKERPRYYRRGQVILVIVDTFATFRVITASLIRAHLSPLAIL
jgi:hypothetical protein